MHIFIIKIDSRGMVMNILKENICVNKVKTKNIYQITMDNDYIISDVKPDITKLIREQGEVLIAALGAKTAKAVEEAGWRLDISAPNPQTPSITAAIDLFFKENKVNKK
jgi:hypothetical protein